jgi:hypothetical protein
MAAPAAANTIPLAIRLLMIMDVPRSTNRHAAEWDRYRPEPIDAAAFIEHSPTKHKLPPDPRLTGRHFPGPEVPVPPKRQLRLRDPVGRVGAPCRLKPAGQLLLPARAAEPPLGRRFPLPVAASA